MDEEGEEDVVMSVVEDEPLSGAVRASVPRCVRVYTDTEGESVDSDVHVASMVERGTLKKEAEALAHAAQPTGHELWKSVSPDMHSTLVQEEVWQDPLKPPAWTGHDTFLSRAYCFLRLDHVLLSNAPFFLLLKIALVCAIVLLIDRITECPDHVSSVFNSILMLHPLVNRSIQRVKLTFRAALVGTTIGTLVHLAIVTGDDDTEEWYRLIRLPLACVLSCYVLALLARTDHVSFAAAIFSALFVNLVPFTWGPMEASIGGGVRRVTYHTIIVRAIALLDAATAALLVNFLVSATAPSRILRARVYFLERIMWKHYSKVDFNAVGREAHHFQQMLQESYGDAIAGTVYTKQHAWLFSQESRKLLRQLSRRLEAMLRYTELRSMLHHYRITVPGEDVEELAYVDAMAAFLTRSRDGSSAFGHSHAQELQLLAACPSGMRVVGRLARQVLTYLHETKDYTERVGHGKVPWPCCGFV